MNPRERKDVKPPPDAEASADDGLVTSEDLFGDMVDAPPEARPRPRPTPPRTQPIRVQVSEPNAASAKQEPKAASPVAEMLPEDMAALLDAFSGPAEAAARAEAEAKALEAKAPEPPAPAPTEQYEVLGLLDELVEPEPRSIAEPAPAEPQELPMLPLGEKTPAPPWRGAVPAKPPAPKAPSPKTTAPGVPADSLLDVPGLEALVAAKAQEIEAAKAPPAPPTSRSSTKFQAATPDRGPVAERIALDLAALAEDAFVNPGKPQASPPPPRGEQHYGPYRLLEKVAVGGMAEVFRAKRSGVEGFEKVVAVKRILPHLSDNKEFVDMFIDEAKMVAGLTHPSIVQIFDLGKIEKSYYIAMEYVHGRDLRSIMKRAKERGIRVPMDITAHIVGKVAAALEYAHRKKDDHGRAMKIVHRDVSPQNILISFEGDVKITDFGIAKAATKASTTERGALRGKLLYMSPEQAWGKSIDRRSDIFSLGIVLYEMLAEEKPFLGSSEMSILEMVRDCRIAPPTQLNPRIPEKLERVALKALDKDPDLRYQDAGEMARDLERALADRKPPTGAELAKFMEVLFDQGERGVTHDEHASGEHRAGGTGPNLEVEFEQTPAGARKPAPAPVPVTKDMSIDKLLKRFGIK